MTRWHYFKLVLAACGAVFVAACGAPVASSRSPTPRLRDGESFVVAHGVMHWVRIAAAARGTTPIVVIHGGPGGTNYAFERTIGPEIERFATVVYYEQRGCGRSKPPPDGDEILGVERMHLLGYSFGGELALEYAMAHPDRVDRLLLQTPMFGNLARIHALQMDAFEAISQGPVHERIRSILQAPGSDQEHYDRIWKVVDTPTIDRLLFHDPSKAPQVQDMLQLHMNQRPNAPLLWRVRGLQTPTLVMAGAHFPDLEEPVKYAAAVKNFTNAH